MEGSSVFMEIVAVLIVVFCYSNTGAQKETTYYTTYKLHTARATWFAAREACIAENGFLLEITTSSTNSLIQDLLNVEPWFTPVSEDDYAFWTGLYDTNPPMRDYIWTNSCTSKTEASIDWYASSTVMSPCFLSTLMSVYLRPELCEKRHMFICEIRTAEGCVFQQESAAPPFPFNLFAMKSVKTVNDCENICTSEQTCAGAIHCSGFSPTCLILTKDELTKVTSPGRCTVSREKCYDIALVTAKTSDISHVTNACGIDFKPAVNFISTLTSSTITPSTTPPSATSTSRTSPSTTSPSTPSSTIWSLPTLSTLTSSSKIHSSTKSSLTTTLLTASPSNTPSSFSPPSTTQRLNTLLSSELPSTPSSITAPPTTTPVNTLPSPEPPSNTPPLNILPSSTPSSVITSLTTSPSNTSPATKTPSTSSFSTVLSPTYASLSGNVQTSVKPSTFASTTLASIRLKSTGFMTSKIHPSTGFYSTIQVSKLQAASIRSTQLLTVAPIRLAPVTKAFTTAFQMSQISKKMVKSSPVSSMISSWQLSSTTYTSTSRIEMASSSMEHDVPNVVTLMPIFSRTSTSSTKTCSCMCGYGTEKNSTKKENKSFQNVLESLEINKAALSSKRRKYTCADDSRPSARYVGCVGAAFLFIVFFLLSVFDLVRVICFFFKSYQEIRKILYKWNSNGLK